MNTPHTDSTERIRRMSRRLGLQLQSPRPGMLLSLVRSVLALDNELERYSAEVGGEPPRDDIRHGTFDWARGHRQALVDSIILVMKHSHRTPGLTEGEIAEAIDLACIRPPRQLEAA